MTDDKHHRTAKRYALAVSLTAVVGLGSGHFLLGRRRAGWAWATVDAVGLVGAIAILAWAVAGSECGPDLRCAAYSLPTLVWFNLLGLLRFVQVVAALLACRRGGRV